MKFVRSSGVLAHPTSFPGKYGIGDLGQSAYDFVDFLKKAGQNLWQVLPLNPTSFGDSPYQSFSTFAGNTLLISPDLLLQEKLLKPEDLTEIPPFDPRRVDYGEVIKYKDQLYRKAYATFLENPSAKLKKELKAFYKQNCEWLDDYTLFISIKNYLIQERKNTLDSREYLEYYQDNKKFMTENLIKDCFYGAHWLSWPKELIERKPTTLQKWTKKLEDEINFQKFIQFEFFMQWNAIKSYANSQNIQIIGDIPIFVASDSADVWANKQLFQLDKKGAPVSVAGVPPDYFSATGQLWGNPLYDWQENENTGFVWWINRIRQALSLVDILRIDHFRGFESYWSVPYGAKNAIKGSWKKGPGIKFFESLEKSLGSLPIIAEDLGIITDAVEELRDQTGFPGMKVLQFGFDAGKNNTHLPHNFVTANSVLYTGTHDNDTTLGWYNAADQKIKDQFRRYLNTSGESASWDMIRLAFMSISVIAITPLQDIMSLESSDRMNTPGVPEDNWQFRYTSDMLTESMAEGLNYLSKLTDRNIPEDEDEPEEQPKELND